MMVNQNLVKGLLLAGIALFFIIPAPGYKLGTLNAPGPGLFPLIVSSLLLIVSIAIVVRSRLIDAIPLDFKMRNILLVTASLVAFVVLSEYVNMLAGIAAMVTIACLASDDFSVLRVAIIVVALSAIAFAMKYGLGVQLPLY